MDRNKVVTKLHNTTKSGRRPRTIPVVDVIKLCFGGNLEILDFPKIGVISDKVEKFRKV